MIASVWSHNWSTGQLVSVVFLPGPGLPLSRNVVPEFFYCASCRQEVLLLDNEISFNEAIIEEREQGIQEIQQQIGEVNEIFKDLAVLVHEQGVMIGKYLTLPGFSCQSFSPKTSPFALHLHIQMISNPTLTTPMRQLHRQNHNLQKQPRPKNRIHLW